MFNRWRKQKEEGVECPLCGMHNPEGTAECPRCYFQLEKGILEQEDQPATEQAGGLFDELNAEDDDEDEAELVDWTAHTFEVDDVTIDVSQYEEDSEDVNIGAAPGFATYGKIQPELADHPEPTDEDPEEWELNPEDAPTEVERFVVPDKQENIEEDIPDFKVDLVVPLLPKQGEDSSMDDDSAPLHDPSAVPDDANGGDGETAPQTTTESTTAAVTTTAVAVEPSPAPEPAAQPAAVPEPEPAPAPAAEPAPAPAAAASSTALPSLPTRPVEANNGAATTRQPPSLPGSGTTSAPPSVPALPAQPTSAPPAEAFGQTPAAQPAAAESSTEAQPAASALPEASNQLWPWPQVEPWDDLTVRRGLREVMEQVKANSLEEAGRSLDKLGPRLGEHVELIFHVGVVLKKLEREQALARLLEAGQRLHPDDENVANAVSNLG